MGKKRHDFNNIFPSSPISSRGVQSGNLLFISGITANKSDAKGGPPMQQLRVILDRITRMVADQGGKTSDIVKLSTYVTNIDEWFPIEGEHVDIYDEFFGDKKPANLIIEINRLAAPGLDIEIEALAVLDSH